MMVLLDFICIVVFTMALLLYVNNIIVDIGSAIASSRTITDGSDVDHAKFFAKYRMALSFIMGITLAIIICF